MSLNENPEPGENLSLAQPAPDRTSRKRGAGTRWGKPVALTLALTLVLGGGGVAAWAQTRGAEESENPVPASEAETAIVTKRNLDETANSNCQVDYEGSGTLINQVQEILTALPATGDVIHNGERLYSAANQAVSLLHGALPAWRELAPGMTAGADITQLKAALTALGYGTAASLEATDSWTATLTQAVKNFQKDRGLPQTGTLTLGSIVFVPQDIRVDKVSATIGSTLQAGDSILEYVGTKRKLTCEIESSKRRFVELGAAATVRFPDGKETTGTVSQIAVKTSEEGKEPQETLKVSLDVLAEEIAEQTDGTAGQAAFSRQLRENVLTVPVASLTALAEGGFAVQRKEKNNTLSYVPVETGIYSGTWVEITGGNLNEGDSVVVAL